MGTTSEYHQWKAVSLRQPIYLYALAGLAGGFAHELVYWGRRLNEFADWANKDEETKSKIRIRIVFSILFIGTAGIIATFISFDFDRMSVAVICGFFWPEFLSFLFESFKASEAALKQFKNLRASSKPAANGGAEGC